MTLEQYLTTKPHQLSQREAEVAALVSTGLSNREAAVSLFVTEKTVKFHLTNIYKKMGLKSRSQLIVHCSTFVQHAPKSRPTEASF